MLEETRRSDMHLGSCLCGTITYEVSGLEMLTYCHCSRCRKDSGSAFATNATVREESFRILTGEQDLHDYCQGDGHRLSCAKCSSPLFSRRDAKPGFLRLRMGCLDTPIDERPTVHCFVGSKANWYEVCDELPQHVERPPGF
jgi:hypothetical protein